MVRVLRTAHAKRQLDSIYNDYDLAYIGERFSESFKESGTIILTIIYYLTSMHKTV